MSYRNIDCPECGRHRVEADGVCEKCQWDIDGGDYVSVTRPHEFYEGFRVGEPEAARLREYDEKYAPFARRVNLP